MIEVVQEFFVKEEARGQFELAYGPGGAWSNLFARSPGYRGTTVLRDTEDRRRYLTITLWSSAALQAKALAQKKAEYAELQATFDAWAESKAYLGIFRVLAEATVRPMGGGKTSKDRATRRGPSRGRGGTPTARG